MFLKIYIFPSIFISTILAISTNSWFTIWMMLELNLMSFTPLIIFFNNFYKEISVKYFIIQAMSSSVLLISTNSFLLNFKYNFMMILLLIFINMSIFMKLGMAPFHFWYITVMSNSNWMICLILSTWQKIIPLMLLNYASINEFNYIIIMYSLVISTMHGFNHQSIRIIMAYSSLNHMSWMLINLTISEFLWMLYFIMYTIISIPLILSFNFYKIFYLNQIYNLNLNKIPKFFLFMNFLSISGLPPTFGFMLKWLTLNYLFSNKLFIVLMISLFLSILTFMFYIRITIPFLLFFYSKNKIWNLIKLPKLPLWIMFFINFIIMNLWFLSFYQ